MEGQRWKCSEWFVCSGSGSISRCVRCTSHTHALLVPVLDELQVLSALVRGGFLVSLLGSFALLMYPLRTCLIELLWGGKDLKGTSGAAKAAAVSRIQQQYYVPLTYGILTSTVATAVLVPDIWAALSIVGDLASTMQVGRADPQGRWTDLSGLMCAGECVGAGSWCV